LVILNGVSSSGKTSLASAFRDEQARSGDFWLLIGIDDALSKPPVGGCRCESGHERDRR
jgi:chloramphenicol 3-O-phosphotransferase